MNNTARDILVSKIGNDHYVTSDQVLSSEGTAVIKQLPQFWALSFVLSFIFSLWNVLIKRQDGGLCPELWWLLKSENAGLH
jgi:hypothetical protein